MKIGALLIGLLTISAGTAAAYTWANTAVTTSRRHRATVIVVNCISKDGKGYIGPDPVYSIGVETGAGEQCWFKSVHKMVVGKEVCIDWFDGSGWAPTPCPDIDIHEEKR